MTPYQLRKIIPYAGNRAELFAAPLTKVMEEYEINTPARQAAFIAQVAHESGSLRYTEEIASGAAYEGRSDLGNIEPGDGIKNKGHGLIQLTGRANHEAYAAYKGMTMEKVYDYLQTTEGAADVSGWFWKTRNLNELADVGNFIAITKRINGGTNGLADRQQFWERAKGVLQFSDVQGDVV